MQEPLAVRWSIGSAVSFAASNDVLEVPGVDPMRSPLTDMARLTGPAPPLRRNLSRAGSSVQTRFPHITGVAGLNDLPGLSTVNGNVQTCQ